MYGRHKTFGAWMLDTLMLNLILLVGLTWMMGCYDALGVMLAMELQQLLGVQAV